MIMMTYQAKEYQGSERHWLFALGKNGMVSTDFKGFCRFGPDFKSDTW